MSEPMTVRERGMLLERAVSEGFHLWHRQNCPTLLMGVPDEPSETCADVETRDGPPGLMHQRWAREGLSFFGRDPDPDDKVPSHFKGKSCPEVYADLVGPRV